MPSIQQHTEPVALIIGSADYQRLVPLIRASDLDLADALDEELSRADIVEQQNLPADVVAINSTVTYRDLETKTDTTVRLVFPAEAEIAEKKISVLSPVGVALLGLRTGGRIQWPMPNGKNKHFEILAVTQS